MCKFELGVVEADEARPAAGADAVHLCNFTINLRVNFVNL